MPCGACNPAGAVSCCECGAARWDGPDGQLQQRVTAALQTADLDISNIRQVLQAGGTAATLSAATLPVLRAWQGI